MKQTFAELDQSTFQEIVAQRKKRIAEASSAPIRKTFPVNELAKKLHPNRQYMKIAEVEQLAPDAKRFRLVPDPARGTTACAPFKAGQYLNVFLDIDGMKVKKYIRHELFGEIHDPASQADYPGCDQATVKITVTVRDRTRTVTGKADDSILQTLEKNGIAVPTRCRSGECGFCHSRLCAGKVYVPKTVDGRRLADFKYGYIHPCVTFPLSDIEIEVPADK